MSPRLHRFTRHNTGSPVRTGHTSPVNPALMIGMAVGLSLFGLAMIYNVSAITALTDFGDRYHYVREQSQWLVLAIISLISFSIMDYRKLYLLAVPILFGCIILLFAVFIPGLGIHAYGATRWLNLGFMTLQPTEFAKLALIIYLAAWFSTKERRRLLSFVILMTLIIGPVVLQPDLGSAVVIVVLSLALYFLSGAPLWQFGALIPVIIGFVGVLAISAPYRLERIKTFLNPNLDPQGTSYHLRQILIALGTGGWLGVGLGKSRQKFAYLPEVTTDSIFAVISEEVGLIGATLLMVAFLAMLLQGIRIAQHAPDRFGVLLAGGLVVTLSFQVLLNLGAMVSLVPLTGIPLPFVSYGGSNLVISCTMVGILTSIARSTKKSA